MKYIEIKGARANNLKGVDVRLPQGRLTVVTGLSGSGKSSLAFDTLFAEGQRRYVESLSSYARQFLGRMTKPEVDYIHGLSPAVAIGQRVNGTNPRSTVGTQTEVYEYLKLLYARVGRTFSPVSGAEVKRHTVSDVVDYVLSLTPGPSPNGEGSGESVVGSGECVVGSSRGQELPTTHYPLPTKIFILAPLEGTRERPLRGQLEVLRQEGYQRVMVKGTVVRIDSLTPGPSPNGEGERVFLVVDRVEVKGSLTLGPSPNGEGGMELAARVSESVQSAFFEGRGECVIGSLTPDPSPNGEGGMVFATFSNRFEADGIVFEKPNVNFFSFNNPYGACPTCQGYGHVIGIDEHLVVPNPSRSVYENAVVCWNGERMQEVKREFVKQASRVGFPIHKPYYELSEEEKAFLWHGDGVWEGIDGFFRWVESQSYKIQYRVMLSRYRGRTVCPDCGGSRLRKDAEYVKVGGRSISEVTAMPVGEALEWVQGLEGELTEWELKTTERIRTELRNRLGYLVDVGLSYLTLSRRSNTLSGGESQRIVLATSLGSALVGSMYILDEPSIGLHSRDTERLIGVLKRLRDLGNTVVVVEHDEDIIRSADWLVDMGPGAGRLGGEVVFSGPPSELEDAQGSLTADYLLGRREIEVPRERRRWRDRISIRGAYANNLKGVDVEVPLGVLTVVTGVSGSGKSSLVRGVLYDVLRRRLEGNADYVGSCVSLEGDVGRLAGVELVDQNPIGRSTRSNPATYMKVFDEVRALYARQPLAKARGYKSGFFSFNVEGGRCEACEGEGYVTVSMQFMSDVHLLCEECHGSRYKEEALEVLYKGKSISEVLEMTVDQACEFFDAEETRSIYVRLKPLQDVGLGYLKLGQSSSSLSGGEAQRIKLASYLVQGEGAERPMLFIFDEPSTGLHFHDIQKLLAAFSRLIERGHSVVVIEHHHDIIKTADWVIDLGPEGGEGGGRVVFAGTPEGLVRCKESYTARYLKV
ncbi:MAG: excinuclease ABC subunit UvrA [Bacteroidales bacterium]|nr:excinuclease ABC subunit UvrA [Bacteroidales bacterium]